MARKTTVAAFPAWIAQNEAAVLESIAGGRTLQQTSVAMKQPYTCLHAHFESSPELKAKYDQARKSWVDFKNDVLIDRIENVPADKDEILKVKLQAEVIANQSKAYYRERWGEKVQVEKSVSFEVDQALMGTVSDLLRIAKEKVVSEVPALPAVKE